MSGGEWRVESGEPGAIRRFLPLALGSQLSALRSSLLNRVSDFVLRILV
jgi:hypothetical protein